jgi:DNA-binding transcriptional ArsR family regulator
VAEGKGPAAFSCIEAQGYDTKCATISGYSVDSRESGPRDSRRPRSGAREHFCRALTLSVDTLRILRKYIRKMRTSPILTALFPAVRQEILAATLLSPERSWYLSELAAHLKTSPSSLQRELEALAASGILERKREGRRTYYRAEIASPVFAELRDLFSKTAGLVPLLQAELDGFGQKIAWAAIYGSIARGQEQAQSDIDLLIVGPVSMQELLPALRRVERQFGREVNVTRYSEDEFRAKRRSGNHFLNSVLKSNLITVVGSLNELEKTAGRRQSSHAQAKQKGTNRVEGAHRSRPAAKVCRVW